MDPDHFNQPSKNPSSIQRRHHRPGAASSTPIMEGSTEKSKRREKSNSSTSRGSRVSNSNLYESKESLVEDPNDEQQNQTTTMTLLNKSSSEYNNLKIDATATTGRRPKYREVGKVKPIRIIPPPHHQQSDEIKFDILKSTSAWEEDPSSDNQMGGNVGNFDEQKDDEDFKEVEAPEKMFVVSSSQISGDARSHHHRRSLPTAEVASMKHAQTEGGNETVVLEEDEEDKDADAGKCKRNLHRSSENKTVSFDEEKKVEKESRAKDVVSSEYPTARMSSSSSGALMSSTLSIASSSSSSERVKVIVRSRPMSKKEIEQGHECVVTVNLERNEIEVRRPQSATSTHSLYSNSGNIPDVKVFAFDAVYDDRISQKGLYDDAFRPLVDSVLEGYNGTIFAYGQTGTGKTFTMEGVRDNEDQHGVIPNAFKHIFGHVEENSNRQYLIRASYLEIYQEDIRDLLSKDKKQHRELKESPTSGVYVKDLSTYLCSNFSEINDLMTKGNKNRAVGATNMNEHSSRSHAIFQITIEVSELWPDGQNHFKVGKLNLVDLAGSERQGKTGTAGERLKEATKINLSLSALGNVIAALVDGKSTHIPYRDSKLTRLLQDSLGGNSHTIMVATVGPASFNWEETITTLRYASRAKRIKNKPKVNEDPKDAMLRQYQEEIARLRTELEKKKAKQAEMLQRSQQESSSSGRTHTGRSRSSRVHTASSTASDSSSSTSDQLRQIEEQRMKELAHLLAPYGVDPSGDPQDIMNQLDERRLELLNDSRTVKEERDKLLKRLDETQSLVRNTAEECKKLSEKIQWLESKVLTGGKSLVDHTNEQQKLIQAKQQELAEQTERYEEMRRKIQENELTTTELRSNAEMLEAELHTKTKKLKKLSQKLYFAKEELVSVNEEHVNTMKELENVLMELKKEFSLKRMIIDNFIPYQSRKMIESRIVWDKQMEEYRLASLNSNYVLQRPPMNRMTKTPLYSLSETGTVHMVDNVHYLDENVLQLHPELPKRRTKDYVPPSRDPYITSLIKRAVEDAEKEVYIDCRNLGRKRTKTAKIPQKNSDYFKMGDNLVCRRVKSAKPVPRPGTGSQPVQFRDFVVVSNFHRHFSPGIYGHSLSVLRGGESSEY